MAPLDLLARIDRWAEIAPERVAFTNSERELTYRELVQSSRALAAWIERQLRGDRSPIVVHGHKEPEVLIGFLAAIRVGHPYVPVESNLPKQRLERIVATAGSRLILTPERIAEVIAPTHGESLENRPARVRPLAPADPYYIMFTSGSTGEPKGVVITLRCLLTFLTWLLETQTFAAGEVFLNQVPYSFDVSIMDTYGALLTGGTIFSLTRDDVGNPKRMYQLLAASNLTTWVSTPSFAQLCLAERTFNATMLPHLRRFLFCGEALPPNVAAQLLDRFPSAEVWNTYGPTETTVATTAVQVDRALLDRYPQLPIGTALPNTEVLVVGPDRTPLPEGERGEIVIVGPNVSPGYIGRPDLTERSFFEVGGQPAYATGDWGRSQHGLLFTDGRIDSQIKLHGHRIELGDVEANLCALPGVSDAVVVPVVRNGQAESLSAFVILAERPAGTDFELSRSLQRRLGERVPDYMVPRKFHFLEALPMNANGKADRRQLIEPVS